MCHFKPGHIYYNRVSGYKWYCYGPIFISEHSSIKILDEALKQNRNNFEDWGKIPNYDVRLKGVMLSYPEYFQDQTETQVEKTNMQTLYQIKDTETFGYVIATTRDGKQVFEPKGGGAVQTVDKDSLVEVFPYTVAIKFQDSGTHYHYFAKEGQVKKGDILIIEGSLNNSLATVMDLDTKSKKATKDLKGRKVVTEEL